MKCPFHSDIVCILFYRVHYKNAFEDIFLAYQNENPQTRKAVLTRNYFSTLFLCSVLLCRHKLAKKNSLSQLETDQQQVMRRKRKYFVV